MQLDRVQSDTIALIIFDQAVNQGLRRVGRRVQKTLSELRRDPGPIDGIVGPLTLEALNSVSPFSFNLQFLIKSLRFYAAIVKADPSQSAFILGWVNRVGKLMNLLGRH
jgi:lysozyme family protein